MPTSPDSFSLLTTSRRWLLALVVLLMQSWSVPAQEKNPFALGVRETEPLTAEQELTTFRLPPGFRVELVASEPQIAKPMNLAFDTRGRLWVSSSEEYPFAAKSDSVPRDTIRILEDTDGDGRTDKVTTFADKLNIPIGLYPYRDGVICFSIPNIMFLRDTDGDDICDVREVLYGPFDTTRDTHGMNNSFRRGSDGWIYACHGFNNRSEVKGRDGNVVSMSSGNTYRFQPDGSRIEHFTHGQVNPFGMAIDQFDDILTADCHTKPVTLLIQGGYYESFGKPHDGLGYVPNVMEHLHGSTAIGGIALGQHTSFPSEFQRSSFGGNVMTSRINRNTLEHVGSTVKAIEQPDLMSTSDPWFRPVDMIAGPDGSLYVADFYNRIIGHYEVDLYHPGRDRHRGRIWKISYVGDGSTGEVQSTDVTRLSPSVLVERLATANYQTARMIADHITDEMGLDSADRKQTVLDLKKALKETSPVKRQRSLRILQRMGQLNFTELKEAATDTDELVRLHAFRALNTASPESVSGLTAMAVQDLLQKGFSDSSPLVRRAAVIAAARHTRRSSIPLLLKLLASIPTDDVHLRHATRMTLRDHLRNEDWFRDLTSGPLTDFESGVVADLCLALKTPAAGEFIASNLASLAKSNPGQLSEMVQFAAAYVSPISAELVAETVQKEFPENESLQLSLLTSMAAGLQQRGMTAPAAVNRWAERRVLSLLGMTSPNDLESLHVVQALPWQNLKHPSFPDEQNAWTVSYSRRSSDGMQNTPLHSSFENGEQRTGIYRSSPFELTEKLSFYVAGHDGIPSMPLKGNNYIRLRDANTNELFLETPPRRNDVAQRVEWETSKWRGRMAVVELVDGDSSGAYAWMSVGRFSDERLNPDRGPQKREQACQLIALYELRSLEPAIQHLIQRDGLSRSEIRAMASALIRLQPDSRLSAVSLIPSIAGTPSEVVQAAIELIVHHRVEEAREVLARAAVFATSAEQLQIAEQLTVDQHGSEVLVALIEAGKMSARLLTRPTVSQRLLVANTVLQDRIRNLTASLPDENAAIEKLIAKRRKDHASASASVAAGAEIFRKNCAVCHQVAGEGRKVGPNLDGIGNRGLDRVVEDVLAPNRNVDVAFRTSTVVTVDGRALTGLVRELEGDRLSITDSQGRETLLPVSEAEERIQSALSPMPANVAEILNDQQFHDLLAFLLSLRH
ncbi:MAG: c-type cytochrome [Planctomycetaceae bacterium]|nr:c-type cytochrome [Planctomycetaceae bacterium]